MVALQLSLNLLVAVVGIMVSIKLSLNLLVAVGGIMVSIINCNIVTITQMRKFYTNSMVILSRKLFARCKMYVI